MIWKPVGGAGPNPLDTTVVFPPGAATSEKVSSMPLTVPSPPSRSVGISLQLGVDVALHAGVVTLSTSVVRPAMIGKAKFPMTPPRLDATVAAYDPAGSKAEN